MPKRIAELIMRKIRLSRPRLYKCSVCGYIGAPFLVGQDLFYDWKWKKEKGKLICYHCYYHPDVTEEKMAERREFVEHANKCTRHRILYGEYGKMFAKSRVLSF